MLVFWYVGNTCLHFSVLGNCSKEVIQAIMDHGANVNATDNMGRTAFMLSCRQNNVVALDVFLKTKKPSRWSRLEHPKKKNNSKADPNIMDICGNTCLHSAVEGHCGKELIQAIIDRIAHVNATNLSNETALILACRIRNIHAMNALLYARANPNMADVDGDTCLHYAVLGNCSKEVIQTLVDHGADVNAKNNKNRTALMLACWENNVAIDVLLNAGANPNIVDTDGNICLHDAIVGNCGKEFIRAMIGFNANVYAKNKKNQTPLILACRIGNIHAMDVLLNTGTNHSFHARNHITSAYNGNSLLHYAVYEKWSNAVLQVIIVHGADANETNMDNVTPLMIACENKDIDAIYVLLNAGANPNIVDGMGDTCLHAAVHAGCQKEVVHAIIDHGADLNITDQDNQTALVLACCIGKLDIMNVILHCRADPNIADIDGDTLLHIAVQKNVSSETLQVIIDNMADVNVVNYDGKTALLLACSLGQMKSVNVLLKAGADSSIVDVHGDTCLHKILYRECDQEALQLLLDYGAPVNATNNNHQTACMLACDQGNADAICALENAGADLCFSV